MTQSVQTPSAAASDKTLRRFTLCLALAWTVATGLSAKFLYLHELEYQQVTAVTIARTSYMKDIAYRRWNASHGGVYVPVSPDTPPNSHLDVPHRDVRTTDGQLLTLVNPAYMTRQVHEQQAATYGLKGHITSLHPIRPANVPDPWERKSLELLQEFGLEEHHTLEVVQGEENLRYMRAMITEEPCLKCHAKDGYTLGSVRGGISVSVPMAPIHAHSRDFLLGIMGSHLTLWLMGLGGIAVGWRLLARQGAARLILLEQARQAQHAAEAATNAKAEFLANMSHEIRTPLNGVMGMLQLIKGCTVDSVESYAEMALRAGQRLTSLLNDILDLSRIEAGRMPIVSKPFVLANLFTALTETFLPMNYSKSLSLVINVSSDLPTEVVGDEVRVRQILFNLVGNALKFSDLGEVRVEVSPLLPLPSGQTRLLFVVSDAGLGIPESKLGEVCAPFVQASSDLARSHQGAGLGLSIARRLIEAMGGTLTFESTEGQGTSVYLVLPFGIPLCPVISSTPEAEHDAGYGAPLRLLLVEDEEISRLSVRLSLQKLGHKVDTANNGEEALQALRSNLYDCVLMDIQMDVLNGLAATRAIRSGVAGVLDAQVPIVAMTAYAMSGDQAMFLEAGMNDYVPKPVDMNALRRAIERVMGGELVKP